ncbi:MAG: BTAD domain-containing putative transcriptional regulator [Ornithinimicrobium sp.]
MGALEIAVLGPVRVLIDGKPVAIRSVQQRVLLARLALEAGRPVSVARIVETLWPVDVPANAEGNLQSYVSRLRALIGSDRLVHEPGGYQLAVDRTDIDIGVVRSVVADSAERAVDDPAGAAGLLQTALKLWRGTPLADLPDSIAFAPELAHLEAWHRQLLEEEAALLIAAGDAMAAIPDLQRRAVEDPLRERTIELLMRALHQCARTTEALAAASSYRRRLADETGMDPGHELRELEQRILTDDPSLRRTNPREATAPPRDAPTVLRPPSNLFVGRGDDLHHVRDAVAQHPLVTVVGPGGIGKTRLVLEFLRSAGSAPGRSANRDDTFVDLAPLASSTEVVPAVAAALGLTSAPSGTLDALVDRLSQAPSLLVLDNCEHVRSGATALTGILLARCAGLAILTTSRRRLDAPGECVVRLAPLTAPAQADLFCARAALLRPGFDARSTEAREIVAQICEHLDGLPLAVELAARREAVFGLRQLRDGMAAGLEIIDPVKADQPRSGLAMTAEWSYRLLDESARALFDRLSVCADGFSVEALAQLGGSDSFSQVSLAELVDASMVLVDHAQEPPRYRILEPMRQMGARHLDGPSLRSAELAHTAWIHHHLLVAREAQDQRAPVAATLLSREASNIREALRRAIAGDDWNNAGVLGLETALLLVDHPRLDLIDRIVQLGLVSSQADLSDDTKGRCLAAAGAAQWLAGRAAAGVSSCDAAVSFLPDAWPPRYLRCMGRVFLGDTEGIDLDRRALLAHPDSPRWVSATAVCLSVLLHEFDDDHQGAIAELDAHTDLLAEVEEVDGFVSYTRGEVLVRSDPRSALTAFERAEAQCLGAGQEYNYRVAQVARASLLVRTRDPAAAAACLDTLAGLRDSGMWTQAWMMIRVVAELLVDQGSPTTALALLEAADADPLSPPVLNFEDERLARVRAAAVGALAEGAPNAQSAHRPALTRVAALSLALKAVSQAP